MQLQLQLQLQSTNDKQRIMRERRAETLTDRVN